MSLRIEDYALIGDCESAALVGLDGSIDWLCMPRFDSAACFAALLGTPDNGRWQIVPEGEIRRVTRRYRPDSLVLETLFETDEGTVALVDCMAASTPAPDLVRLVVGRSGRVRMRMELVIRFEYGQIVPWVTRLDGEGITAIAGPNMLVLRTPAPLRGEHMRTRADFVVAAGETVPFVLTHSASHLPLPDRIDGARAVDETERGWRKWAECSVPAGEWSGLLRRSLITLKALTYRPTGGIVAAPTTSLPEEIGGGRNWDYRFCWLRDATFTLLALKNGGYSEEAKGWRDWLKRAVAGSPSQIRVLYGVAGERHLPEWNLDWLAGYEDSLPVRVGNAAAEQLQLDVFGEVVDALHQAAEAGLDGHEETWALQRALVEHMETVWREPDEGIWEVRGGRRHFTHSKVMCWVAVDRAIQGAERHGGAAPLERWRKLRDEIHEDVCTNGFDAERGTFVQSYGSKALDASLLLIPLVGFLPSDDPRVAGTVEAIGRELMVDGLVLRYRTEGAVDGLPPGEGAFLACSFWYVDNLVMLGRHGEAEAMFRRLAGLANDVGLLAEEYDPRACRMLGNFPQAFSHVALVNSAYNLTRAVGPAEQRAAD